MANISNLGSSLAVSFSNPTLVVTTGTGANFPAAPFYVTATPPASLSTMGTSEILLVTAKSGDTFTVTRAQKGTSTKSIAANWVITNGIYVEDLFSTITFGEVPSGTVNGTNTVFTTAQPFTSIEVFKNGIRMKGAGNDYTVTNNTTITFVTAPAIGATLLVNYIMGNQIYLVGSNSLITDETPSGTINGVNTTFTTAQPYIGGSLQVFVNGVKQKRVTNFTETTPSTGSFTISDAPISGDDIMVCYQYVLSTTANADTVDGYHANVIPTANMIPVLDANGKMNPSTVVTIGSNFIGTVESLNNSSWSDLSTVGPVVTINVPVSGRVLVTVGANFAGNATGSFQGMGFALSGANSVIASDDFAAFSTNTGGRWSMSFLLEGLTPGSTTFTAKYKTGGNFQYSARRLIVEGK